MLIRAVNTRSADGALYPRFVLRTPLALSAPENK